jgi:hypothetical protein
VHVTLTAGSDAGGVVLFDPAALPDDFDTAMQADPMPQLERLGADGRLFWINTEGDGSFSLGVFADGLPDALRPYAKTLQSTDRFRVPGGRLFFTGVEYAFRSDDSLLRKYPHMGEALDWPAGEYAAVLVEFVYPDDFHERLLRDGLTPCESFSFRLTSALIPVGCVSFLLLFVAAYWLWKANTWAFVVLPILLFLVALPLVVARLPVYRRADAAYTMIQREFPAYGVVLALAEPTAAAST